MITTDLPGAGPLGDLGRLLCCPAHPSGGGRCLGRLEMKGERLQCITCMATYPVIGGVPVLRGFADGEPTQWFETMYEGRDRSVDLQTEYLAFEREKISELVAGNRLTGPCLEVGCGTGMFSGLVPGFVGLEYSLRALVSESLAGVPRVGADASRLPFIDGCFQLIFSFSTLEHVERAGDAFAEMHRVLAPGGLLALKPAWHCARYQTELIPIRAYSDLSARQKLVKALLPLFRLRAYKLARRLPWRLWRRLSTGPDMALRWRRLTPSRHEYVLADQDAAADLDCHEGILFYVRRGYQCLSHPAIWRQLIAGHDFVVLRKPPV